jgi:hypothetical protein
LLTTHAETSGSSRRNPTPRFWNSRRSIEPTASSRTVRHETGLAA